METVGGDLTVLDLEPGPSGKKGQIFSWYNNGSTTMEVVADSFPAWLDALARELVARRFTLDEMGTINLKRQPAGVEPVPTRHVDHAPADRKGVDDPVQFGPERLVE
jgi:hypothetical protein